MEAASRPTLELLSDLPVEEPLDIPVSPAVAAQPASAPVKSVDATGIEFINPETLFGPDAHLASAPPEPQAPPTLSAPATTTPQVVEPELTLEDPKDVDRLLTSASASTPAPTVKAAATPSPVPTPAPGATMVPLASTASLSAAATKLAAAARHANHKGVAPAAPVPAAPAPASPAQAAPSVKAAAESAPVKPPVVDAPSLASWASARESAALAKKPTPSAATSATAAPVRAAPVTPKAPVTRSAPPTVKPAAAPVIARAQAPAPASAPAPTATVVPAAVPMDRDFVARNQVVERYLSGRLPLKGATEFEHFCHENPELLDEIGLPERVNAGLRLLEAAGKPEPWQEKAKPAWQKPQLTIGLAAGVAVLGIALLMVIGSNAGKSSQITALKKQVLEQPLDPATSTREIRVLPSRSGASNTPAITIGGGAAQLADLKIDESRSPFHGFRVTIDRIDQGRVAVITNLAKDSNGNLRVAFNSSALGPGAYQFTIEGITWRGDTEPDSWVTIGVAR